MNDKDVPLSPRLLALHDISSWYGIMEMRIAHGPGYRIYYVQRGIGIVILLCGGDKHTQRRDIARAQALAKDI